MDGDDGNNGGKEYLELIAQTLGGDVDNEEELFDSEDESDEDKDEDDTAKGNLKRKKAIAAKAHNSLTYKSVMSTRRNEKDLSTKVGTYLKSLTEKGKTEENDV
jgi:hypothetical protein